MRISSPSAAVAAAASSAATGLDIVGADVEAILRSAEAEIDKVE